MSSVVLDASALLAMLFDEPGADKVARRLSGAYLSAVNLSEAATRMIERGVPLENATAILSSQPLHIVPFDAEGAYIAASFRPATRKLGLSLGDRACLALGFAKRLPVLTADQSWAKADVGIEVEVIR